MNCIFTDGYKSKTLDYQGKKRKTPHFFGLPDRKVEGFFNWW